MKINTKNILQNKFVLYLVFFLSLVSVFGYITTSNFQAVLLFVLISLLTNYFSKNMIVILGAAIIGTNLVTLMNGSFILNNSNNVVEGFEENMKTDQGNKQKEGNKDADEGADEQDTSGKHATKQDPFTNQELTPAVIDNIPNIDNLTNLLSKSDKGKKTEKAYDMLENAMNNDNIKGLAGETKNLLGKQVELMNQMKQITPILQQTMGLVNNLDLGALTNIAKKVTDVMPDNLESLISQSNELSQ